MQMTAEIEREREFHQEMTRLATELGGLNQLQDRKISILAEPHIPSLSPQRQAHPPNSQDKALHSPLGRAPLEKALISHNTRLADAQQSNSQNSEQAGEGEWYQAEDGQWYQAERAQAGEGEWYQAEDGQWYQGSACSNVVADPTEAAAASRTSAAPNGGHREVRILTLQCFRPTVQSSLSPLRESNYGIRFCAVAADHSNRWAVSFRSLGLSCNAAT